MMGLSSMMAHLMAFCSVIFSGRRYPTDGTEAAAGGAGGAGEEAAADFIEERRGVEAELGLGGAEAIVLDAFIDDDEGFMCEELFVFIYVIISKNN